MYFIKISSNQGDKMTTYKDLLIDNLNRAYERFERAFNGVTIEEADRFPVANQAPQIKS
jgi:hypothetical protein